DVYIGGSGQDAGVWVAPAGTTQIDTAQTRPSLVDVAGMGFNAADELYVGDRTTVVVFPAGSTERSAARTLTGIGQVIGLAIAPENVADLEGTVYVSDYAAKQILRFSPEPVLTVDKATVDYVDTLVNTTTSETITISNSAGADLIMDAAPFAITGANPNRFSVTATTCASAVLVRNTDSCTVDVAFAPNGRGDKTADLEISSSAPENPYLVQLSGKGIAPVLNPNPFAHDYGAIPVDGPAVSKEFTITNSGDAPLVLPPSSVSITGAHTGSYSITADTCAGSSTDPGGSCAVTVDFGPTATGAKTANLRFVPNAPETPKIIELAGAGTVPGFAASASSKAFSATIIERKSAEALFTITSTGNQALEFDSVGVSLGGTDAAQFEKSTDTCSGASVAAAGTCEVGVKFAPTTVGSKNAEVRFANNAPDSPQTIALSGYANPTAPEISLSANLKDFDDFVIGSSTPTTHTFTVTNSGTATLDIGSTTTTGSDPEDFTVLPSSTCATSSVAVGDSCDVVVNFAPNASGDKSANLRIDSNDPSQPHTLPLTGSAFSVASAPGQPTATSGANGQAALSWPAPTSNGNRAITGYRVEVSTSPSGSFTSAAGGCAAATSNSAKSCTATGLANGTAYYFKVAAINVIGTSDYSASSSAATPAAPPPPPVAPAPVKAQTLARCNLAKKLKKRGTTKLQKGACITNAGQRVSIKVKLKGAGKRKAKVKQNRNVIKIKAKGAPLKVILRLRAPAVPGFTAFSRTVKYKAK
ncbi:MAG: choice-of-anchor D domain-containing protein, partial [Actinobacteria bacterium]|nr:choice-of-anchor D domain-containing protein [Actinomycetota bacterium]